MQQLVHSIIYLMCWGFWTSWISRWTCCWSKKRSPLYIQMLKSWNFSSLNSFKNNVVIFGVTMCMVLVAHINHLNEKTLTVNETWMSVNKPWTTVFGRERRFLGVKDGTPKTASKMIKNTDLCEITTWVVINMSWAAPLGFGEIFKPSCGWHVPNSSNFDTDSHSVFRFDHSQLWKGISVQEPRKSLAGREVTQVGRPPWC